METIEETYFRSRFYDSDFCKCKMNIVVSCNRGKCPNLCRWRCRCRCRCGMDCEDGFICSRCRSFCRFFPWRWRSWGAGFCIHRFRVNRCVGCLWWLLLSSFHKSIRMLLHPWPCLGAFLYTRQINLEKFQEQMRSNIQDVNLFL